MQAVWAKGAQVARLSRVAIQSYNSTGGTGRMEQTTRAAASVFPFLLQKEQGPPVAWSYQARDRSSGCR